ncbi:MAG: phage portal protein [Clostridia bacterium]|nr:phage portal protein [Clostridia bacterium]
MGLFKRKPENRAFDTMGTSDAANDLLLTALLGNSTITKQKALNIPSVNGCIEYIANTISMLPIKLYMEDNGKVKEVKEDPRIKILNDETGDTLDSVQFWKAMVADYFLGKGGYAYINKQRNSVISLHYVDESQVSINKNADPIFKDYDILVNGSPFKPFDFIKLLRKTKDGCQGISILSEIPTLLSVGYNSLVFENALVQKGGNKKGFLKSENKLEQDVIDTLKEAWKKLYSNNEENIVVLNKGIDFKESSNSSVEMQLNENKVTNSLEFCKIFNVPDSIVKGAASEKDYINGFRTGVLPIIRAIECALNRDFLLEKEKGSYYWAFDTKEITKGDILTRYQAYEIGIKSNFLQPDEVRYEEDKEPLGLNFIKLGLDSVLYDPIKKTIYTPNTDKINKIDNMKGGEGVENNSNTA